MTLAGTRPPLIGEVSEYELHHRARLENVWGGYVNEQKEDFITGIWIALDKIPVINIWQAPNTIAELKNILEQNGISWEQGIIRLFDKIRDTKVRHYAELHHKRHMYEYNIRF